MGNSAKNNQPVVTVFPNKIPKIYLWKTLAIWAIVCLSVFLPYQFFEHSWLESSNAHSLEVAHLVRGLSASMAATLATTVYLIGSVVPKLVAKVHQEKIEVEQAREALSKQTNDLLTAQTDLRRERERLQTIIDCMADAVVYATPDGSIRLRNRAAMCLWSGQTESQENLRACHPPQTWQKLFEKVTAPEAVETHPVLHAANRSFEASYARVCDLDGSLLGVVMVARDITERIVAQEWKMRQERMAVVGKLAAELAHELNNPLGAIALFTQHALEEVPKGEVLSDYLGTVLRNANLCKKIVRSLLEYARRREPSRQSVSIEYIIQDVVRTLKPQAQSAGIEIVVNPSEFLPTLWGDPDQLHQTLVNLGLNAIEAMPDGGQLTIRTYLQGPQVEENGTEQRVCIEVQDTGMGIAVDDQTKVFDAFHTTKAEGTGLGLNVARDICQAHGGLLELSSELGKGSVFRVILPLPTDEIEKAGVQ